MKLANGVEEVGHSGLEPTLFAHQLGSPSLPPGRSECGKIGWYLRLLSVGAQVSGSGDSWQSWDLLAVPRARNGTCGSGRGLLGKRAFWGPAENQFGKHFQH